MWRILRRYIDRIGYGTNFTIYDAEDQKTVMRDVCKRLNIDTKLMKEKMILGQISSAKDELIDPGRDGAAGGRGFNRKKIALAYREYQNQLKRSNALDFDDLIMKTVELFWRAPDVLESYQELFSLYHGG